MKDVKRIDDGGPAFPGGPARMVAGEAPGTFKTLNEYGMSLRDWFAGQALVGFCAKSEARMFSREELSKRDKARVEAAWRTADAMLKARSGGEA